MLSPFLVVQILCIGLFIYGIRLMNSPETAVTGNLVGAVGMAGAIIMTMVEAQVLTMGVVWAGLLVGTALGVWLSAAVKMIQMPQMVALLNGFGGAASFIVATLTLLEGGLTPYAAHLSSRHCGGRSNLQRQLSGGRQAPRRAPSAPGAPQGP